MLYLREEDKYPHLNITLDMEDIYLLGTTRRKILHKQNEIN